MAAVVVAAVVFQVALQVAVAPREVGDMANAIKAVNAIERETLSKRIGSLEERTDAEVVCAVATESGRYDRADSICGLIFGVLALIVTQSIIATDGWGVAEALYIGWQVALIVAGFMVGTILCSYWHGLRRLLVTSNEMDSEVQRSMHAVFSMSGIGGTKHHGGLLIYLSLFEHRLEVHGDKLLLEKVTVEELESIRDAVLQRVRAGKITDGLLAGLEIADGVLARALPHTGEETDTLANDLLVFHPRP
jgi:putative membrane protein